nr:putative cytochrome C oxidase subunit 6B-like [Ipomoea batatas]
MSAAAPLDPHDKMRGRDVNKVARGEQAPRPVHQPGTVSAPPPPSTDSKNKLSRWSGPTKVRVPKLSPLPYSGDLTPIYMAYVH